jgi:DNA-binding NtrC family response regulator
MKDGRKEVLVVDDDPDVLRSFMRLLQDYAEVKVALGAEAAIQVLGSKHFDAIVVDFNMVGPNGAWLLRQVRDRYPHIERILLSGSSYSDLSPYLDPGLVDRFIEKPLEVDELIEAVSGSS